MKSKLGFFIRYRNLSLTLSFVALLPACRESLLGDTDPGTTDPDAPTTDPGVVDDNAGFYVKMIPNEKMKYHQHQLGDYSKECKLTTADGTSASDITCVVDLPEDDLFFHGVSLQWNVPSTMCKYVVRKISWFENFEVGAGHTTVTRFVGATGLYGVTGGAAGVVSGTPTAAANGFGVDGAPACEFDYTGDDGPNCCTGKYSLTTRTWNPDPNGDGVTTDADYVPVTVPGQEWGGDDNLAACYAGAGFDVADSPKNKAGFPVGKMYYVDGTGYNDKLELTAPSEKLWSNAYIANWYNTLLTTSVKPTAFSSGTQDAYEWTCYDRAHEPTARIRMYIREWNTYSKFLAKDETYSAAPGGSGFTGSDEVASDPGPGGGNLNDRSDWDDFEFSSVFFPNFQ